MKKQRTKSQGRIAALTSVFIFIWAACAFAAMGEVSAFSLISDKGKDMVGANRNMAADGTHDAGFSLSVRGSGAITRIVLADVKNNARWDTSRSAGLPILAVYDDQGAALNKEGDLPIIGFVFGTRLTLWVNDRNSAIAKDGVFEVTVHFVDQSSASATVDVKGIAAVPSTSSETLTIVSALLKGPVSEDFTGPAVTNKKIGASGRNDWATELKVRGTGTITGFRLRNTSGAAGAWDTFPTSNNPLLAIMSDGSVTLPKIFNKADGTVAIPISGDMTFYLLAEDNGSLADDKTESSAAVYIGNKIVEASVKRPEPADEALKVVSFDYRGRGRYDFVGTTPRLEKNLAPDMELVFSMTGGGTINGIRITGSWNDSDGRKVTKTWDTIAGNSNMPIAVTRADGKLLNRSDSTVSIAVKDRDTFSFWIDDDGEPGDVATFRADVAFSDGRILTGTWQAPVEVTPPATTTEDPKGPERSVRLIAKPSVLAAGVVNKTEVPASGSKNNVSLIVRVRGKGTIVRMSLVNQTAAGSWDTNLGNKIPLLGVRQKSALVNDKKTGAVKIAVNNSADLELVVEDNGSLRKSGARFLLNIAWSDGELTKELLAW